MASGLPYTIIKPGGLLSTEGGRSLLIAGHDDELQHARCACTGYITLCTPVQTAV